MQRVRKMYVHTSSQNEQVGQRWAKCLKLLVRHEIGNLSPHACLLSSGGHLNHVVCVLSSPIYQGLTLMQIVDLLLSFGEVLCSNCDGKPWILARRTVFKTKIYLLKKKNLELCEHFRNNKNIMHLVYSIVNEGDYEAQEVYLDFVLIVRGCI